MHLFAENLAVEISSYYRNLALAHGVIPKVFTLVNSDGDQYLFFIDDLRMEEAEESQFLAYIVQAHDAVCYARGTLVILDKTQQLIEFAVIDRDNEEAIVCSAELTRIWMTSQLALLSLRRPWHLRSQSSLRVCLIPKIFRKKRLKTFRAYGMR